MGENIYTSVVWRVDAANQDKNIEILWRNWFRWKRMISQSFSNTWKKKKNYTRPSFTKYQLSNSLGEWGEI